MMLGIRTSLGAIAALLLSIAPCAAEEDFASVDAQARKAVESGELVSVSYAVMRGDQLLHVAAFGWADREAKRPARVDTRYPLASVTKPIAATAVMRLVAQDKLALEAPLSRYLDVGNDAEHPLGAVTIAQLLSHTGGLGTYARIDYGDDTPSRPLIDELRRFGQPVNAPGRIAEYSNLGYGALGEVLAQVSGQGFDRVVRRQVLDPLGLKETFVEPDWPRRDRLVARYDQQGKVVPVLRNNTPAAGNAWSTARDLARFGAWHAGGLRNTKFLDDNSRERMQRRVNDAFQHYYGDAFYGLGWYVREAQGDAPRYVWHEGGMPGASTLLLLVPDSQLSIAVLGNQTDVNPIMQRFGDALLRTQLPKAKPNGFDPVAGYRALDAKAGFSGTWRGELLIDDASWPCEFTVADDGGLHLRCGDAAKPSVEGQARGMTNGDSLIGAIQSPFASRDVTATPTAILLLKLVRTGNRLAGGVVAYEGAEGLRYLLPYRLRLERVNDNATTDGDRPH